MYRAVVTVGRSRCRRATCARPCVHILRVLITGDQTNLETSETAMTSCSSFLSFSLVQTQPPSPLYFIFPFWKILRLNVSTLFIRRTASSACWTGVGSPASQTQKGFEHSRSSLTPFWNREYYIKTLRTWSEDLFVCCLWRICCCCVVCSTTTTTADP